jgi:hypothetical protein
MFFFIIIARIVIFLSTSWQYSQCEEYEFLTSLFEIVIYLQSHIIHHQIHLIHTFLTFIRFLKLEPTSVLN